MNAAPRIPQDSMFQLLRMDNVTEFNKRRASGETPDLRNVDLRGSDLRRLDAKGLDLSGCYFRQADLRGVDFSQTNLDGCSINGASISGTLFPRELSAEEIRLSHEKGTRMRYR